MIETNIQRGTCYNCYRPKSSCMCKYINKIKTNTQFIILMHNKEFRKTKNGTGRFTYLSLPNSKIFIGIDFSNHKEINQIINDQNNNCFILYPDLNAIKLNNTNIQNGTKKNVIFIIDSTWNCSSKILRMSSNLHNLPRISFTHTKVSQFQIKTQPKEYCLSTIESTVLVLEFLNYHKIENITQKQFSDFLEPFRKMIKYQINRANESDENSIKYKKPYKNFNHF